MPHTQQAPLPVVEQAPTRWGSVALVLFLAGQTWAITSTVFVPSMLERHPVLLELLNGSSVPISVAGAAVHQGHASLPAALFAPLVLDIPIGLTAWWVGRLFGPRVVWRFVRGRPRGQWVLHRCERLVDRFGGYAVFSAQIVPLPAAVILAAAGWRRIGAPTVAVLYAAGILAKTALFLTVGYIAQHDAQRVAHTVATLAIEITATLVVVVAVTLWLRWSRRDRVDTEP